MADDARPSTALDRPALASVLATVTDRSSDLDTANVTLYEGVMCSRCGGSGGSDERCGRCGSTGCYPCEAGCNSGWWPWAIETPAEALEALVTRGVLPPSFAGDAARWFWCSRCARQGWQSAAPVACVCESGGGVPSSILDLLAWASLGGDAITRAEQLAREAATRLRPWGARAPVETATTPDGQEVECEKPWRVVWKVTHQRHVILVGGKPREHVRGWPITANDPTDDQDVDAAWLRLHARARRGGDPHPWWAAHVAAWPTDAPPCPHEPVLSLLRAGIGFDAIDGDALVLVCPPLGGSNA